MANTIVKELVNEINETRTTISRSSRDETRVMKAMLNDTSYKVGVYNATGLVGEYCPAEDFKAACSNIIASTTKISKDEAAKLADKYEASKEVANSMVNLSKEFINTYLQTGRKLSLGGRELSEVSLNQVKVDECTRTFPLKVGVNEDGSARYSKEPTKIPTHYTVSAHSPCPEWVKK